MGAERDPLTRLDPVIHPIQRLRICVVLDAVTEEEFATLRDLLGMSDSALSKQLSALADVGYLEQRRATRGGRSRVWARLTPIGRRAFHGHVDALRAIASPAPERAETRSPITRLPRGRIGHA